MFKGLGNLGNIASMIGKLQDIPQKMQELNEQMRSERVTASSSCGAIRVTMNGVGEVQLVEVDPKVPGGDLSPAAIGEAIREATNAAGADAKRLYAAAVSQVAADMNLNLPGMDGLLSHLTGGS